MAVAVVETQGINKFFATSQALNDVTLAIRPGECLGLVGHNGAGKSTLMNILSGIFPASSGHLFVGGEERGADYDVHAANRLGMRTVFQELSLCLNLTVVENMRVFHPRFNGSGWKKRAAVAIMSTLDEIFPGHGITPGETVERLTLGQRQTLEIAKAFARSPGNDRLRLLILDEPTSALDYHTAKQLLDYLMRSRGGETAFIYISHMLEEVLSCTNRILVMKDGKIAGGVESGEVTRDDLIHLMGSAQSAYEFRRQAGAVREGVDVKVSLISPRNVSGNDLRVTLNQGEIIGLAGLAGHGQTDLLVDLFASGDHAGYNVKGKPTFIPGDRQRDGVFPLWSIMHNLTLQAHKRLRGSCRLISGTRENAMSERWKTTIGIKAGSMQDNIFSLSGGNQQKVLFARCLESDSPIILMDDPTRGVDVATKEILYRLIFAESAKGRGFVWYTTEMAELQYCDRVYVFKGCRILAEMPGDAATEDAILKASF